MSRRILAVHNRYQIAGGEDRSHKAEVALLRRHGHVVDEWVEDNDRINELGQVRAGLRSIWSQESYRHMAELLANGRYDLVLIQNFFPLISPAVYYAAQSACVPVVQTLRNYRLLCANALFLRDGQVCEDCLGKPMPWQAVRHACYRQDRLASTAVAMMQVTHRLLGTWQQKVTLYVALTQFARHKFIEGGLPADKIVVKPNFVEPDPGVGTHDGRFALFVGRLSAEKGLDVLLHAWEQIGDTLPLHIIGDGPLRATVAAAARENRAITWRGQQPHAAVLAAMQQATLFVFPSLCYEGLPRTIVEAYAVGLPVIASNHGSMRALVENGRTGLHFPPGAADKLAAAVSTLFGDEPLQQVMGHAARQKFEAEFTPAQSYAKFLQIFEKAHAAAKLL